MSVVTVRWLWLDQVFRKVLVALGSGYWFRDEGPTNKSVVGELLKQRFFEVGWGHNVSHCRRWFR